MFNKSKFNRTPFNRVPNTKYTVTIESTSDIFINQKLIFKSSAMLNGQSTFELVFKGAIIESTSTMTAKAKQIIAGGSVDINSIGELVHSVYNIQLESESTFEGKAFVRKYFKLNSNTESDMTSRGANLVGATITIDHTGQLTVTKYKKEILNNGLTLTGQNTTDIVGGYVITDVMILTIPFAPGEEIIIDMEAFQVLKNGQNILNNIGDISEFFNLEVGNNVIQYRDNTTSRSLQATITHQDRY